MSVKVNVMIRTRKMAVAIYFSKYTKKSAPTKEEKLNEGKEANTVKHPINAHGHLQAL